MFDWLFPKPKPPLPTAEKTWIEVRMAWLVERLGRERLLGSRVILPEPEFFPDPYSGSAEDARRVFVRLCGYMDVDANSVDFDVAPDGSIAQEAELQVLESGKRRLLVAEGRLAEFEGLVSICAHELADSILLGGGFVDPEDSRNDRMTALLPVCLGLGIFPANDTVRASSGQDGQVAWWTMSRRGYLPSWMFGYALALFAFARGERSPTWAGYLRPDAAGALRDGLAYLQRTKDSEFLPETAGVKRAASTPAEIANRLKTGSPSARLAALWEVGESGPAAEELLGPVATCLRDRDPAVASAAATALTKFGASAAAVLPELKAALWGSDADARASAADALAALRLDPNGCAAELCCLLELDSLTVFLAAAEALTAFGVPADEATVRKLAAGLKRGLIDCDSVLIETAIRALLATAPDADRAVRGYFAHDPELLRFAVRTLGEHRPVEGIDPDLAAQRRPRANTFFLPPPTLAGWR